MEEVNEEVGAALFVLFVIYLMEEVNEEVGAALFVVY